jgi:hypothetical protein
MYDCDVNGANCVRKTSDLPFAAGITVVTWTAYSHDTPGPYVSSDDEVAHRTGSASCQQNVTVNDVTPPTITAENTSASADANCLAPVPDYSTLAVVSDNCACASSDTSPICSSRGVITITQSPAAGTLVGLGPHDITLTANDGSSNNGGAGNTATIQVTFTVNDTTAPTITCPSDMVNVHTDPGICAATLNPGTATAADNCSSPTIVGVRSDAQPLNALYPKGVTIITWTATDGAGNHSSCNQTITVIDAEPPTITLNGANPMTVECHTSFTDPQATAHDNCSSDFSATASGSVDVNVPGSYTLTYSAIDAAGNSSTATRTVNVIDTTAPTTAFDNLTIFFNNLTIVFNTNSFTVNGTTYPFNGVSCTHEGYTFTFNGQTVTITKNGHSVSYTFSGRNLVLWTPTHQYQTVKVADLIASAGDTCDTTLGLSSVVIQSVSSDEPEDIPGGGDGNTLNDIVIAPDCKSVQVRAERNGSGNGRVYTVTFRVRDAYGNTTTTTSKLKIFANSLNVVDDGAAAGYTVNSSCP